MHSNANLPNVMNRHDHGQPTCSDNLPHHAHDAIVDFAGGWYGTFTSDIVAVADCHNVSPWRLPEAMEPRCLKANFCSQWVGERWNLMVHD